jgi:hypothetical protein
VGALSGEKLGAYINEHFVSSYQKVGTFKIVGNNKQGGNVASYFCAPDGRVLHAVAGPVDAATLLREATWVVDTVKAANKASEGNGAKFKAYFRTAHADKLKSETGLTVAAITYDFDDKQDDKDPLTYKDPSGRTLSPKLPPPPIDGPDVKLTDAAFNKLQEKANAAPGARYASCGVGLGKKQVVVNNQAVIDQLLSAHALMKIESLYGTVFENVLGEKVSTKPVDVVTPFSWMDRQGNKLSK